MSVFGLIFADGPARAVGEAMRVLRAEGRALVSVWHPHGAIHESFGTFARAAATATGEADRPRFPWHDETAVGELAVLCRANEDPSGFRVHSPYRVYLIMR